MKTVLPWEGMCLQPGYNNTGSEKEREGDVPEIREPRKRGRASVLKSMEQSVGG